MKKIQPRMLAKIIARYLNECKATNVVVRDVTGLSDITDFFVFATGSSTTFLAALAETLSDYMKQYGYEEMRCERFKETRWIVVDYSVVVVPLFTTDVRLRYQIEDIWADAKNVIWKETKRDTKKNI